MVSPRRSIPAGAVEGKWAATDGWQIRRIDWPAAGDAIAGKPRGSILFLPGRGDCYEKYLETLDHWAKAGWKVASSDWRGQGGSGRLGKDATTGHIDDFAIWVADLGELWRQWAARTPPPHILIGHSMGGHLVLRALAEGVVAPDGVVLSAPMLGFLSKGVPDGIMHELARFMAGLGDRRRPAWKWSEKPGEVPADRANLLTHDPERYADELWWRQQRPELAMGPASWGWVERAYSSMRGLFRQGTLERVKVPVFIIATDHDGLVDFAAIARAARRLPNAELMRFGAEAHHEILREADPVRNQALASIDAFLNRIAQKQAVGQR